METSILGRIKEFLWQSDLRRVVRNPMEIMNIENPSEKAQVYAVLHEPELIQHLKNPCEKAQMAVVRKDPSNIMLIDNPAEKVQLNAVRNDPAMIQHIHNPTEKVQLEAVRRDPVTAMFNIDSPTEKVQLFAINTDASLLAAIKKPCEKAQLLAVKKMPELIEIISDPCEKVQLAAISGNANAIKLIKNPTEKAQMAAVSKSAQSIQYIKNPTERVQLMAISQNINHVLLIDNPSNKVCISFVNAELGEKLFPLNTSDPTVINLIKEYLKEKKALEAGISSSQELLSAKIDKLKESIREIQNGSGANLEKSGVSQDVQEKGQVMKEANSHHEGSHPGAGYADDFSQRIHEKEMSDEGKSISDKNYKPEIQNTIDNDGIPKADHTLSPDEKEYLHYASPQINTLKESYLSDSTNDNSNSLFHGSTKEMKFRGGCRELTIKDGEAVIRSNGQTFDATGMLRGMKEQGVDINKVPEGTMKSILKGKQVKLPGADSKTAFAMVKGPAGYTLKALQVAKQADSIATQEI